MNLKKLVTAAVCTMLMAAVAFTAGCGGEKKSDKKVLKVGRNALMLLTTGLRPKLTAVL